MKKSTAKANAPRKPAKLECAGPFCHSGTWFKLGLTRSETRMLKAVAGSRQVFIRKTTSAGAARVLLQAALAHFDVLLPLLQKDAGYCQDEGFLTVDHYLQGLVEAQHQKLSKQEATS